MTKLLRILILEDRGTDVQLMLHSLRRAGFKLDWQWVDNEADFLAHLEPPPDIILADYSLPQFDARRALRLLAERKIAAPLILVSGTIGEDRAAAAVRDGAADFVHKQRLARLPQAVTRALEEKRLAAEQRQTVQRLIAARQQAEEELRRQRAELDRVVTQRTAALRRENEQLQRDLATRRGHDA